MIAFLRSEWKGIAIAGFFLSLGVAFVLTLLRPPYNEAVLEAVARTEQAQHQPRIVGPAAPPAVATAK